MNTILHSRMKRSALNLKPIYICERCKDTGWIKGMTADPHGGFYCDCNSGIALITVTIKKARPSFRQTEGIKMKPFSMNRVDKV